MLQDVEWGEFRYNILFRNIPTCRKLIRSDIEENGVVPIFSSESSNNGIIGYTNKVPDYVADEVNPIYVVFGDHTRNFNITTESFCVADNVKVLLPHKKISINSLLYITTSWKNKIINKGYSRHWSFAKDVTFSLPTRHGEIDYDFMERFIQEIENERII